MKNRISFLMNTPVRRKRMSPFGTDIFARLNDVIIDTDGVSVSLAKRFSRIYWQLIQTLYDNQSILVRYSVDSSNMTLVSELFKEIKTDQGKQNLVLEMYKVKVGRCSEEITNFVILLTSLAQLKQLFLKHWFPSSEKLIEIVFTNRAFDREVIRWIRNQYARTNYIRSSDVIISNQRNGFHIRIESKKREILSKASTLLKSIDCNRM